MKIIIAGAGLLGTRLAKELITAKYDVVVIEKNPEQAERLTSQLDCLILNDEGNHRNVLIQAGVEQADFFIAVTESDEVNMISCGLVKSLHQPTVTIARVRSLEYSVVENMEGPFLGGIDHILNPDLEAARSIIRAVEYGATSDILSFDFSAVQIRNLAINETSDFLNRSIKDMKVTLELEFLVAVLLRNNRYIIPTGNTMIHNGDTLYIIGPEETLERVFQKTGLEKPSLSRILIVGGGKIGAYIADQLIGTGGRTNFLTKLLGRLIQKNRKTLCIIDRDMDVCKDMSIKFPQALVINGDVSDEEIFDEEQLFSYDVIITTTKNQELNILSAVYVKSLGVPHAIVLVNKASFTHVAIKLGVDVAVSIKSSMINSILRILSRGRIRSIQSISEGKVEAVELTVNDKSKVTGKPIKDIRLPGDWIIVSISREGKHYIPNGSFILLGGDEIIIITQRQNAAEVETLFTGDQ